ncbi:YajG family lipoprotein [Gallibacterium anatis]|uniref:YajG family lipoprotein n=1 Tax=Gallibacterium anatis TaxID=750 RepID=UPI0022322B8B|nr:YajG family lipoprotein [Gallibacterium anatis]UZD15578.1 YajG family lipoprotein [Gallibacterium anatis]
MYKSLKRFSSACVVVAGFLLAACQAPQNTITFTPPAAVGPFNAQNQNNSVSVASRDLRSNQTVSQYTYDGQLYPIFAQPSIAEVFQQALQQDLNSKGFRILPNNAPAVVTVNVKQFYANVNQGNVRYKIDASVQLTIQVQSAKGEYSKNIETHRSQEGAFGAKTPEIQKVLNQAFTDAINGIYQDQDVSNAIIRLTH